MSKRALITGVTGQDGAYLARLLLDKGYEVHGITRRCSVSNTARVELLCPGEPPPTVEMHYGDLTDALSLVRIIDQVQPSEVYNLAAQTHVRVSFDGAEYAANTNGLGALRLLEAIRLLGMDGRVRFYQASTSELFGGRPGYITQDETTPFYPRSPYASAKLFAYWTAVNYREAYGMHASNGILFNHESPLRGEDFVTRKVTKAVAEIELGQRQFFSVGNLDARRDWGHARDYVEGMWLMLQQASPNDYVLATGQTHSVRELIETAFAVVGQPIEWRGRDFAEEGVCPNTGTVLVRVDPDNFRPTEVDHLQGDPTKAREGLGWRHRTTFSELIHEMVLADLGALVK